MIEQNVESENVELTEVSDDSLNDYDKLKHENEKLKADLLQLRRSSFWITALDKSEGTELIKDLKEFVQDVLGYYKSEAKGRMQHSIIQTVITTFFLGLVIAAAVYLTSKGYLDGSSTTFLLGTITGYYITYLTRKEFGE